MKQRNFLSLFAPVMFSLMCLSLSPTHLSALRLPPMGQTRLSTFELVMGERLAVIKEQPDSMRKAENYSELLDVIIAAQGTSEIARQRMFNKVARPAGTLATTLLRGIAESGQYLALQQEQR